MVDADISPEEQVEALVALVEHRSREVQHLNHRISYYQSQLKEAENRLNDSQSKLGRLRGLSSKNHEDNAERTSVTSCASTKQPPSNGTSSVKVERRSISPIRVTETSSARKSVILIPGVMPKASQHVKPTALNALHSSKNHPDSAEKSKGDKSVKVSNGREVVQTQEKGTKRKFEHKEHKELIPVVRNSSRANPIRCELSNHISSQHKRKLRTIALCPVNDQLFVTSALDGVVNLWQVQSRGCGASLLSNTDCSSQQRRWAEDMAWHPDGSSVFSVYSADGNESQISVLDLNSVKGKGRVTLLEEKPHVKGMINSISFMPWEKTCFATGGSDHAVILWDERAENVWNPKALHRNSHSSAVMGVAGMAHKHIVLSVGADKRIIGFDAHVGRPYFTHQIQTKCMSVLPNPCDFNLFMVHTGTLEKQLRLFDIRLRQTEIHGFGWKQESSESQSALINQSWSPDGLYITSGSADPMIHIFDIRFNSAKPSQSIRAHQKRVFKAVWLKSLPLILSISSDLQIGLHKIT